MTPPWHLSYLDQLLLDGLFGLGVRAQRSRATPPVGSWLPFFYNDKKRTFFVLPTLQVGGDGEPSGNQYCPGRGASDYYPEIKKGVHASRTSFEGRCQDLGRHTSTCGRTRPRHERRLSWRRRSPRSCPGEPPPPYTDEQVQADLLDALFCMRFFHFYLGARVR